MKMLGLWIILGCAFAFLVFDATNTQAETLSRHNEEQAALKVNKELMFDRGCKHPTHTRRENIEAHTVEGSDSIWLRGNLIEIYCTDKPVAIVPIPEPEQPLEPEPEPPPVVPGVELPIGIHAMLSLDNENWTDAALVTVPTGSGFWLKIITVGYAISHHTVYCCKTDEEPHLDSIRLPEGEAYHYPAGIFTEAATREIYWDSIASDGITVYLDNTAYFKTEGQFTMTAVISGTAPAYRTDGTPVHSSDYSHFAVHAVEENTGETFEIEYTAKGFSVGQCISTEHTLPEGVWDFRVRFFDTFGLSGEWSDPPVHCVISRERSYCDPSGSSCPSM